MERQPGSEKPLPRNFLILKGKKYCLEVDGVSETGSKKLSLGLAHWEGPVDFTVIKGKAEIYDNQSGKRTRFRMTLTKFYNSLDEKRVQFFSDVFERRDVIDQEAYHDAVAEYLLGLVAKRHQEQAREIALDSSALPVSVEIGNYLTSLGHYIELSGLVPPPAEPNNPV